MGARPLLLDVRQVVGAGLPPRAAGNRPRRDERFQVGYAPPGPTSLIQHLTARGASIEELVDAGLARETERGRLVDSFRDRLVFPIYSGSDLVGFIGRRNPTKDDHEFAGPKYLNTRGTAVVHQGRAAVSASPRAPPTSQQAATPVLVEGPMDAIAVTLASRGEYVGIAPLGTAFTESQAAKLKPYLRDDPSRIVIATDPDSAGWQSAQRAFWRLAALRAQPEALGAPRGHRPGRHPANRGIRARSPSASPPRPGSPNCSSTALLKSDFQPTLTPSHESISAAKSRRSSVRFPPKSGWRTSSTVARTSRPVAGDHARGGPRGRHEWTDDPQACVARELAMVRPSAPAVTRAHAAEGIRGSGAIHELDSPSVAPPTSLHVSM